MHLESPLRVPLFRAALKDPDLRLVPRAIDSAWFEQGIVSRSYVGFNPFAGSVYYASESAFARYFATPHASGRLFNESDHMMRTLLFVVHDYLHAWAYATVRERLPELDVGRARITPRNLERFAYVHLLTEAVATVGLDYWLLGATRLSDLCPMGTALESATCAYREWHRVEYARVWPDLVDVQDPSFLHWLFSAYLSGGVRMSIREKTMHRSAQLSRWISGELTYSSLQRRHIRAWLLHLGRRPRARPALLERPVTIRPAWAEDLTIAIAHDLWGLVKRGERRRRSQVLSSDESWHTKPGDRLDFDLTNLNAVTPDECEKFERHASRAELEPYLEQQVIRFRYARVSPKKREAIRLALRDVDAAAISRLLRNEARVPQRAPEPRDLMFYA